MNETIPGIKEKFRLFLQKRLSMTLFTPTCYRHDTRYYKPDKIKSCSASAFQIHVMFAKFKVKFSCR